MPAVVMDDEASTPEDRYHAGPRDPNHSSLVLSRVTSAPEPQRPDSPSSGIAEFRIQVPKAATPYYPPKTTQRASSPVLKHRWSAATSVSIDTAAERPEKRLRLDKRQEQGQTQTFRPGGIPSAIQHESLPQIHQSLSNLSPRHPDFMDNDSRSACSNCWGTEDLMNSLVKSVSDLQSELSRTFPHQAGRSPFETHPHEVTKQGLKHSLAWTANEMRNTIRLIQGASLATKAGLPSLADVMPGPSLGEMRRASLSGQGPLLATPTNEKRQVPIMAEPSRPDESHRRQTDYAKDYPPPVPEPSLPPIIPPDEMRRSQTYEQVHSGSTQSHPSPSSSVFGQGHSPMQSQQLQHRSLPSPPGSHFSASILSGPSQFSSAASQAAQASHLQDLQHQISTKTLALQTLQREHDQLLAAFSRSQIRCNTLDKKSQVSDHEINTLTEEKIRLQQQLDSLEAHVDDLQRSRDEVHKQSSADGAQWRQIMAMSSQLQVKGAEDARRFKAEREAWEQDKVSMERRIQDLEDSRASASTMSHQSGASDATSSAEDALTSTSLEVLRQEIVRLRERCSDLELVLQEVTGETEQLDRAINAMSNMRQKLASSKRRQDGAR